MGIIRIIIILNTVRYCKIIDVDFQFKFFMKTERRVAVDILLSLIFGVAHLVITTTKMIKRF